MALRAHALAQEYEKVAGKSSSQSREQFRALLVSAGVACAAAPIGKTVPDLAQPSALDGITADSSMAELGQGAVHGKRAGGHSRGPSGE